MAPTASIAILGELSCADEWNLTEKAGAKECNIVSTHDDPFSVQLDSPTDETRSFYVSIKVDGVLRAQQLLPGGSSSIVMGQKSRNGYFVAPFHFTDLQETNNGPFLVTGEQANALGTIVVAFHLISILAPTQPEPELDRRAIAADRATLSSHPGYSVSRDSRISKRISHVVKLGSPVELEVRAHETAVGHTYESTPLYTMTFRYLSAAILWRATSTSPPSPPASSVVEDEPTPAVPVAVLASGPVPAPVHSRPGRQPIASTSSTASPRYKATKPPAKKSTKKKVPPPAAASIESTISPQLALLKSQSCYSSSQALVDEFAFKLAMLVETPNHTIEELDSLQAQARVVKRGRDHAKLDLDFAVEELGIIKRQRMERSAPTDAAIIAPAEPAVRMTTPPVNAVPTSLSLSKVKFTMNGKKPEVDVKEEIVSPVANGVPGQ